MASQNQRAVTFIEIIVAITIFSIAMIPLFGIMDRDGIETDQDASQTFAINKASEILSAAIDNIPFSALRQGNPGYIRINDLKNLSNQIYNEEWIKKTIDTLFPDSKKQKEGWPCRGVFVDSRGIHYIVHLKVENIVSQSKPDKPEQIKIGTKFPDSAPTEFPTSKEMTFSYLRNPSIISSKNWHQKYSRKSSEKPFVELDILSKSGVAESPFNIYKNEGMSSNQFEYINPTANRYTPKMITEKVPYAVNDEFAWCSIKKLIIQVQWNLEQQYFSNPETDKGHVRRIHLITLKGDLD